MVAILILVFIYFEAAGTLSLVAKHDRLCSPTAYLNRFRKAAISGVGIRPEVLESLGNGVIAGGKAADSCIAIAIGAGQLGIAPRIGDGEVPT